MPDLKIYRNRSEIPDHFYYQAQAFSRIIWYDSDTYDIDLELDEPMIQIVLANGKSLISYAQVLSSEVVHEGISYQCRGLSGVMTFPFFRKRGYGRQVVESAMSVMHEDPSTDISLLWTEPHNVSFYARLGWQLMDGMTTLIGDKNNPTIFDEEQAMMLFLSDKAKLHRSQFENGRVYVGEEQW